jgi:hypothetical protein
MLLNITIMTEMKSANHESARPAALHSDWTEHMIYHHSVYNYNYFIISLIPTL